MDDEAAYNKKAHLIFSVRACNIHNVSSFLVYDIHSSIHAVNDISIYSGGCTRSINPAPFNFVDVLHLYMQVC